jgi:hypothetical protein
VKIYLLTCLKWARGSSVGIVSRLHVGNRGIIIRFPFGPSLGLNQPPMQCVTGVFTLGGGVKWTGHAADPYLHPVPKFKDAWSYVSTSSCTFRMCTGSVCLR